MASDPWQLRRWEEIPAWLKNNPFIRSGYRVEYTWSMCFRSLFMVHNETGNVWSHLLGVLIFLGLGFHTVTSVVNGTLAHGAVFIAFTLSCLFCMGSSVFYHLTGCHSRSTYETTVFLDFCGISSLASAALLTPIYFVFACHPTVQVLYLTACGTLSTVSVVAPWFRSFHADGFLWARLTLYISTVGSGVIPLIHAVVLLPVNTVSVPVYAGFTLVLLLFVIGTVFFVARIPERWYPGHFDLWFNSHQVWHCFSVAATTIHYFLCIGVYQRWEPMQC